MHKLSPLLLLSIFLVLPACTSAPPASGSGSGSAAASKVSSDAGSASNGGKTNVGRTGTEPGSILVSEDTDAGSNCRPLSCAALKANCGPVADGCGGALDCGACEAGSKCGIVTPNTCTNPSELCQPLPKQQACDGKECGVAGDGCGDTYSCGGCAEGESCGAEGAFRCGIPLPTGLICEAQLTSCAAVGAECGQISDGCGGLLDCDKETGGCADGEICGLDGPEKCGVLTECVPRSAADACADKCGVVSNGCGADVNNGLIDCADFAQFRCPEGTACGAGGVPNQCGTAEGSCEPLESSKACENVECGTVSDGCSGSHVCGECEAGAGCRAGVCELLCVPLTSLEACEAKECGSVSDGCGGSVQCGECGTGEACGLQTEFQCDVIPTGECVPLDAAQACQGKECGDVYDGCGSDQSNIIDCSQGTPCPDGQACGTEESFQCGALPTNECTATASCAQLGWACGFAVDDCGNILDCSIEGLNCSATETCIGGIDGPTQCVSAGAGPGGSNNCDVCDSIPSCDENSPTRLSGRVITAGRNDSNVANQVGVPNAFVYILRNNDASELPPLAVGIPQQGTGCDRCDDQDLGPVLASATTNSQGQYVLEGNIPVGEEFILVVKIGKWRRAEAMTLPAGAACSTTLINHLSTRLPRDSADGLMVNIPRIAVSTGEIDAMECVFSKMGVQNSEFSQPGPGASSSARIHMYRDQNDGGGARMSDGSTDDELLHTDLDRLLMYDMVVFDCQGGGYSDNDDADDMQTSGGNVREYVNRGGRVFASHRSYTWLRDNGTLAYSAATASNTGIGPAAVWGNTNYPDNGTGYVSVPPNRPGANEVKAASFSSWLLNENAATLENDGRLSFPIADPRDLATSVGAASEEFAYRHVGGGTSVQQFAFNTPYGAPDDQICGRVAYSGFHVVAGGGSSYDPYKNSVFPEHCSGDLSAQEKTLLYLLFDLGSCVTTDELEPPSCEPANDCSGRCGVIPDGCGGSVDCSSCPSGEVCLAGGVCGAPSCVPTTCAAEGATCGAITDGCGGVLACGTCPEGQECGLFASNQCGTTCTPLDEATACQGKCGFVSDGCGNVHACPGCDGSQSCIQGICQAGGCSPLDACPPELECGSVSDGCSGTLNCGQCDLPAVCGGAGEANKCGVPECEPLTCQQVGAQCGWIGDGCGGALECGECPAGQACGLGGANQCAGCQPRSCQAANAECGAIGDGCGGTQDCGSCPSGQVCGAVTANRCDSGSGCVPQNCGDLAAECGLIGDGCGNVVNCGECPQGELCGIDTAFQCDPPPDCTPTNCQAEGADCGAMGDGCGGLLNCGACAPGMACGKDSPNECGFISGPN